jgi:uncharacterized membrane protein YphA (DoxX/SURF4 family)
VKPRIVAVILLSVLASTAVAQHWFKGSLDEALAKASTEKKRVLVDFFSPT